MTKNECAGNYQMAAVTIRSKQDETLKSVITKQLKFAVSISFISGQADNEIAEHSL